MLSLNPLWLSNWSKTLSCLNDRPHGLYIPSLISVQPTDSSWASDLCLLVLQGKQVYAALRLDCSLYRFSHRSSLFPSSSHWSPYHKALLWPLSCFCLSWYILTSSLRYYYHLMASLFTIPYLHIQKFHINRTSILFSAGAPEYRIVSEYHWTLFQAMISSALLQTECP